MATDEGHSRIGIVSDTHGLLRPHVVEALQGVDQILHAGDVGSMAVLEGLRAIAPVVAIRGNVDTVGSMAELPATEMVTLTGSRLVAYLVHSVHDLDIDPVTAGVAMVVSGHSHAPTLERRNGVVYLNPGSVGARRFKLPISLAFVTAHGGDLDVEFRTLDL